MTLFENPLTKGSRSQVNHDFGFVNWHSPNESANPVSLYARGIIASFASGQASQGLIPAILGLATEFIRIGSEPAIWAGFAGARLWREKWLCRAKDVLQFRARLIAVRGSTITTS
jgi:hypothetical protein